MRTATRIGDGALGGRADGVFVILTLTMTDLKTRPSTIIADALEVATQSGDIYSISSRAAGVYPNGLNVLESLQPRMPKTFTAVYDIPKDRVRGAQLEIRDLGTDAIAAISLGI